MKSSKHISDETIEELGVLQIDHELYDAIQSQ
jgi:hypothetical protein